MAVDSAQLGCQLKYDFSNAPQDMPFSKLRKASTRRWPIEQCFKEGKDLRYGSLRTSLYASLVLPHVTTCKKHLDNSAKLVNSNGYDKYFCRI